MCVFVSINLHPGKQGPLGPMDCMGKSLLTVGGSHGHKQRRAGDYLLFKQIAGPVWPRLQRPLNFARLQMFKSPSEGTGVLQRNKELLGQNSLWIPGWIPWWTASSEAEPFFWLVSGHAERSPGSWCLGGSGDCQAAATINPNKLVENYLMCVRPLLSIQIKGTMLY